MSEHERIYLEPFKDSYAPQSWCQDKIDDSWTEYVLAARFKSLQAENERLREFIQRYRYRLAPKENQPLVDELLGTNSPID